MRPRPLLTVDHAVLVDAAKLANLPEGPDVAALNAAMADVAALYRRLPEPGWNPVRRDEELLRAIGGDLRFLRQSLEELRQGKPVSDRKTWQTLLNAMAGAYVLGGRGRPRVSTVPQLTGVASIAAHALVLLSDPSRGLLERFGRCRYVRCPNPWFFAERSGRRGRFKTEFCRPEHARAQVQLEYRARKKSARHK